MKTSRPRLKPRGTVQVAVWKENPEVIKHQDIFTNYSQNIFYDFVKPLRLLDSPGWSQTIRVQPNGDEGFFVFSSSDRPDFIPKE